MSLLIKNVWVLGAAQTFPGPVNVFVREDKIAGIGALGDKAADRVIDGEGRYLAPGFIDVNSNSDHYLSLFNHPEQEDFLRQGVTTTIAGMCGSSLAPLMYGSLESIRKWARVDEVNVNWRTLGEFLRILDGRRLGVNFGTLIGHSTIRRALIGEAIRDLTKNEMNVMLRETEHALREGGFGVSTGLGYIHGRRTPYQELKSIANLVKSRNGVYATHLREFPDLGETMKLMKETNVKVLVSHYLPTKGSEIEYRRALQEIELLPRACDFHFDLYPFDSSLVALYTFLPLWAQTAPLEMMSANLDDEWKRSKIVKELPIVNPDEFVVVRAIGNEVLEGRTLRALMELFDAKTPAEGLLALMRATELRATVLHRNIDLELVKRALQSSRSLVSANSAALKDQGSRVAVKPERALKTFTEFLRLTMKENLIPLEDAIRKITVTPAKKFGIEKRGEIREGYFADLVVFHDAEIDFVVVNGVLAVDAGKLANARAGKVLRHAG